MCHSPELFQLHSQENILASSSYSVCWFLSPIFNLAYKQFSSSYPTFQHLMFCFFSLGPPLLLTIALCFFLPYLHVNILEAWYYLGRGTNHMSPLFIWWSVRKVAQLSLSTWFQISNFIKWCTKKVKQLLFHFCNSVAWSWFSLTCLCLLCPGRLIAT